MSIIDNFLPEHEQAWAIRAACKNSDPDLFFPDLGQNGLEAKKVCRRCDVREECLDYALRNGEKFGVWGGMSERERWRLRSGLPAQRPGRLSPEDRAEIVARVEAGETRKDLAVEFDVPLKTVQDIVSRRRAKTAA